MNTGELMTVGELARRAGVSIRTLQYYDLEGLLLPVRKSPGGRRLYDQGSLLRLQQILALKRLGFSLEDIRQKMLMPADASEDFLAPQRQAIQQEILKLEQMLDSLTNK